MFLVMLYWLSLQAFYYIRLCKEKEIIWKEKVFYPFPILVVSVLLGIELLGFKKMNYLPIQTW